MLKLLSTSTLSPTKGPGFRAGNHAEYRARNQTGSQAECHAECRAGNQAECRAENQARNQARNRAECRAGNHAGSHAGNDARALPLEDLRCEMRQIDTPVLPNVTARGFHILIWVALFVKVVAVGLVEIVEEVC